MFFFSVLIRGVLVRGVLVLGGVLVRGVLVLSGVLVSGVLVLGGVLVLLVFCFIVSFVDAFSYYQACYTQFGNEANTRDSV